MPHARAQWGHACAQVGRAFARGRPSPPRPHWGVSGGLAWCGAHLEAVEIGPFRPHEVALVLVARDPAALVLCPQRAHLVEVRAQPLEHRREVAERPVDLEDDRRDQGW